MSQRSRQRPYLYGAASFSLPLAEIADTSLGLLPFLRPVRLSKCLQGRPSVFGSAKLDRTFLNDNTGRLPKDLMCPVRLYSIARAGLSTKMPLDLLN